MAADITMPHMINSARMSLLNDRPVYPDREFVLYWMQQSQRSRCNHALELAIEKANALNKPVVVCLGLMDDYPEANERHYAFMLEGLADTAGQLRRRGIKFVIRYGRPYDAAIHFSKTAAVIICDRGYLRHQRQWRERVADEVSCQVIQVECDVVVPIETASEKAEFAARTIRPRIHRHLARFLKPLRQLRPTHSSLKLRIPGEVIALDKLKIDPTVGRVSRLHGGESEAIRLLGIFIKSKLRRYSKDRNEPSAAATSMMSPYLHFGHISPLQIALAVSKSGAPKEDRDGYLEELMIRRELAMNFVHYTPNYDSFECLPNWAERTLESHRSDPRPYVYSRQQLEKACTHDRYWNAAQQEMVQTGFMHNYMRMYWGKKIIEWSRSPKQAYETARYLNNRWFLDGRDPVSYANIGWLFGLHDRPWGERKIFGQIRYMNAAGLERKYDMERYVKWVQTLREG